jgi:hypothetical protein
MPETEDKYGARGVEYEKDMVGLDLLGVQRYCRKVVGTGCLHLTKKGSAKVLRTKYTRIEVQGRATRITRWLVGLKMEDPRLAMLLCKDPRCCNREHIRIGTEKDVNRGQYEERPLVTITQTKGIYEVPKMIRLVRADSQD